MTTALLVPSASPHQEEKPPAYEHKSWLLKTEMVTWMQELVELEAFFY